MVNPKRAGEKEQDFCDPDNDKCVGLGLQIFLGCLVAGCCGVLYIIVIPNWMGITSTWGIINALAFAVTTGFTVGSYIQCYKTDPGWVPEGWVPQEMLDETGALIQDAGVRDAIVRSGAVKVCKKCDAYKPPRSYHCGSCGKCVARMDHHCPWVNNCVGGGNLKYFLLFLFYSTVSCIHYSALIFFFLMNFFRGRTPLQGNQLGAFLGVILMTVVIIFCLSLMVAGLFGWNFYLLMRGETSIENYENETASVKAKKKVQHKYDLGFIRNIKSVMGPSPLMWMMPLPPVGSISHYEKHRDFEEEMRPLAHSNV